MISNTIMIVVLSTIGIFAFLGFVGFIISVVDHGKSTNYIDTSSSSNNGVESVLLPVSVQDGSLGGVATSSSIVYVHALEVYHNIPTHLVIGGTVQFNVSQVDIDTFNGLVTLYYPRGLITPDASTSTNILGTMVISDDDTKNALSSYVLSPLQVTDNSFSFSVVDFTIPAGADSYNVTFTYRYIINYIRGV